ncbi:Hypothetical predicted protein [Octopus vulgaris]|uniref:Uncharacterized protein n=1 Tax=Octopus vulgaris TaxID=6645 RepID=A0AA36AGX1_OCTVU|nr:Hypothetical predicted protein [Octopus vulgaris]
MKKVKENEEGGGEGEEEEEQQQQHEVDDCVISKGRKIEGYVETRKKIVFQSPHFHSDLPYGSKLEVLFSTFQDIRYANE